MKYKNQRELEEAKFEWIRLFIQIKTIIGIDTEFSRFNFNLSVKRKNLRIKPLESCLESLKVRFTTILIRQAKEYKRIEKELLEGKSPGKQQILMQIEIITQLKIDSFNAGLIELGDVGDIQKFLDMI